MFTYLLVSFWKYLVQVTYANAILPLAELEAKQFPLIQSCIFPKMISISDDVRGASVEAEKKIDSHFLMCRWDYLFLLLTLSC